MALTLAVAAVAVGSAITFNATRTKADVMSPNWGPQNPAQSPAGRAYEALAYDSSRGRVVLFGGGSQALGSFSDTWEWDGHQWSNFFTVPSPAASIGPGMAFDSARGVTVLLDQNGQTWEWSGGGWIQRHPATAPPPRVWTSMVYDSTRGVILLFGGSSTTGAGRLNDTWTYDGINWTKMLPAGSPSARNGMGMAFDSARGVAVLFGGLTNSGRANDTWEWNGASWVQRLAASSPFARFSVGMSYDAQLGETVMFGGDHIAPFALGPLNDTWLWDGTSWTRDWTAAAPTPRAGQSMVFEARTGRHLLFGGTDELNPGVFYNDTWELGPDVVTPAGSPALSFSAGTLTFGAQSTLGVPSSPASLFVTSSGTGPIVISSLTTTGDFAVSSSDCPSAPNPLAAGTRCKVLVTFTPQTCATAFGSLNFADNGPGGSQSVALQGGVLNSTCDADLLLFPPADKTVAATSPAGAVVAFGAMAVNDEDGGNPPQTCSPASGSTFPIGTTTVTCSVTDADDATSTVSASFRVTVTDTDLALSGVPADITVTTTSQSGAVVSYQPPTAVDEDAAAPAVTCSPGSGSTFALGTTIVTCTATDADDSPSTVTATFKVTVNDDDLAFSGVPPDGAVDATSPSGAVVNYSLPTAVDEDATAPTVTCRPAPGSTFPIGTTTVTCTATDPDDTPSTISTSFRITVNDTDLALVGVPGPITVVVAAPSGAIANFTPPTAVDEDGPVAVTCDRASGSRFPIGTTTVTCQATDADDSPSTVTASFTVTVLDTDLGFNGPGDMTVVATDANGAIVNYPTPVAFDEEGPVPAVTCDHPSGSFFPVGVMTLVTCSVTDPDDIPSTFSAGFFVSVIPDVELAATVSPTNVSAHGTVTTTATVTNIGAVSRKMTISYVVTFTDSFGNTTTVATDKATVTVGAGQSSTRTFAFAVKNSTAGGTYAVTVTASDLTGSVAQTGNFVVS